MDSGMHMLIWAMFSHQGLATFDSPEATQGSS